MFRGSLKPMPALHGTLVPYESTLQRGGAASDSAAGSNMVTLNNGLKNGLKNVIVVDKGHQHASASSEVGVAPPACSRDTCRWVGVGPG